MVSRAAFELLSLPGLWTPLWFDAFFFNQPGANVLPSTAGRPFLNLTKQSGCVGLDGKF